MRLYKGFDTLICLVIFKDLIRVSSSTTTMIGGSTLTIEQSTMEETTLTTEQSTMQETTLTTIQTRMEETTQSTIQTTKEETIQSTKKETTQSTEQTTMEETTSRASTLTIDQTTTKVSTVDGHTVTMQSSTTNSDLTSDLSINNEITPPSNENQCKKVTACAESVVSQEDFNIVVAVLSVLLFISVITILILICLLRRQTARTSRTEEGASSRGGVAKGDNVYMDLQKQDSTDPIYKTLNTSETTLDQGHVYHNVDF